MPDTDSPEFERTIFAEKDMKRPSPPEDMAGRFKESTYIAFYSYLEARPYAQWTIPDLRQLSQVALLEDFIADAMDDVAMNGVTSFGSQGQKVSNPAMSAMIKAQQQQGAILRRMGISVDGISAAGEMRKMAQAKHKKKNVAQLSQMEDGDNLDANGNKLNLLA